MLASIAMKHPHVLVLDEVSNFLDAGKLIYFLKKVFFKKKIFISFFNSKRLYWCAGLGIGRIRWRRPVGQSRWVPSESSVRSKLLLFFKQKAFMSSIHSQSINALLTRFWSECFCARRSHAEPRRRRLRCIQAARDEGDSQRRAVVKFEDVEKALFYCFFLK